MENIWETDAKSHEKVIIVMKMALLCNNIAIFYRRKLEIITWKI